MATRNKSPQQTATATEGAAAEGDSELVTMYKLDQEPIDVHPTCVKAHVAAGWSRRPPAGDDEE